MSPVEKLQEQVDELKKRHDDIKTELRHLSMEMGFVMRYCRAAAQALGAVAQVSAIDRDRELWEEQKKAGVEEETAPSRRLHPVE